MGVEAPHYFTQKDLEPHLSLPAGCNWRTMIARQEVLAPAVLATVLKQAKDFLVTQPGPNLARRRQLAPPWLDYWLDKIENWFDLENSRPGFVCSYKLMTFNEVADFLKRNQLVESSGILFVAGAEGHEGHVRAAKYMAWHCQAPIWVFEQNSYLMKKERKLPFLPLEVRLSMWQRSPLSVLTVAPEKLPAVSESEHYLGLFKQLGARYCFADDRDPNREEKIKRGELADFLIISHLPVASTTERVEYRHARRGKLIVGALSSLVDIRDLFPEFATPVTPFTDKSFWEI